MLKNIVQDYWSYDGEKFSWTRHHFVPRTSLFIPGQVQCLGGVAVAGVRASSNVSSLRDKRMIGDSGGKFSSG